MLHQDDSNQRPPLGSRRRCRRRPKTSTPFCEKPYGTLWLVETEMPPRLSRKGWIETRDAVARPRAKNRLTRCHVVTPETEIDELLALVR